MSDERTIVKVVGVSLTVVFVGLMILAAILAPICKVIRRVDRPVRSCQVHFEIRKNGGSVGWGSR